MVAENVVWIPLLLQLLQSLPVLAPTDTSNACFLCNPSTLASKQLSQALAIGMCHLWQLLIGGCCVLMRVDKADASYVQPSTYFMKSMDASHVCTACTARCIENFFEWLHHGGPIHGGLTSFGSKVPDSALSKIQRQGTGSKAYH